MQTLEVTDEQHAYVQRLREQLSEEVVGKYGTVRDCDAVQFLIDNLDDELEVDGEFAPDASDGGRAVSYAEGESGDDVDTGDGDTGEDDTGDVESADGDGSASDDDMLDQMMNLLDTHDDKWEESPSADYRYRVELPDGSTEDVQTKDDVRAILFKNY